jgi:hypothetical protein
MASKNKTVISKLKKTEAQNIYEGKILFSLLKQKFLKQIVEELILSNYPSIFRLLFKRQQERFIFISRSRRVFVMDRKLYSMQHAIICSRTMLRLKDGLFA